MNWALALLSAALLIASFPNWNLTWLAPLALAPLCIAAFREPRLWRRFWLGWVSGAVFWFGVCNWIHFTIEAHGGMSRRSAWLVFLLFCIAKAVQTGVFAMLAGWTMRTRLAIPATAALWVLIEYTHAPLGFAWLMLGNAGIDMPLPMRLAPLTGVWGLSFLFAACAAEIANFALRRPGIPLLGLALWPLLFLLPATPSPVAPSEKAVLVQPNIDETVDFTPQSFAKLLQRMAAMSLAPFAGRAGERPHLLIWPESPAPFYDNDRDFMAYLANLARQANAFFVAGLIAHAPDGSSLNSAAVFDPQGALVSRYDKVNLVPFGEFIPWGLGPIAFKVSREISDFQPGNRVVVSDMGSRRIATFICYESVFPRFIRSFVNGGAEVLFNPSNDGWFGKTAARDQHLQIVRMRAAENARWILRATNDGISVAIDPSGKVRQQLPLYEEASAVMHFSFEKRLTLYTRFGDWFLIVCALLCAAGFAVQKPR